MSRDIAADEHDKQPAESKRGDDSDLDPLGPEVNAIEQTPEVCFLLYVIADERSLHLDRSSLQQYRWPKWHAVFQRPGPEEGLFGLIRKVQRIARFKPHNKLMEPGAEASSGHSHPPSCG